MTALAAVLITLAGVGYATSYAERVDGVLRLVAVGSFVGTAVAYRRYRKQPHLDPFPVIARWGFFGFVIGIAIQLVGALT